MPRVLPKVVRRSVPDSVRHSPRMRALALRAGLIPPRTMHSRAESALLRELAEGRRRAVEIGVYEGASALVLLEQELEFYRRRGRALTAIRGFPVRSGERELGTVKDFVFSPAGDLSELLVERDGELLAVPAAPGLVVGADALRPAV